MDASKIYKLVCFIKEVVIWVIVKKNIKLGDWFVAFLFLSFLLMFIAFEIMTEQAISQANKKYEVLKQTQHLEEEVDKCESSLYYMNLAENNGEP